GLAELGLSPRVPEGTYFAMTDVAHLGWDDGLAFCEALPERAGVVAIPAQGFHDAGGRHLVRWAFCKQPDVIEDGLRRLREAVLDQ
ncbi:MAG: aminotransferase, partial [Nocardioides sp.]